MTLHLILEVYKFLQNTRTQIILCVQFQLFMLIIVETNYTAISVIIRSSKIFYFIQEVDKIGSVIKFGYPSLK